MSRYFPKSFHRLVLAGFILMATPPLLAALFAYQTLGRVTAAREVALSRALQAARTGREIEITLGALKQAIMHLPSQALPDEQAVPAYRQLNEQFTRQLRQLANLPGEDDQWAAVGGLIERANILGDDFSARSDGSLLAGQLYRIDEETRLILHASARAMEQLLRRADAEAADARRVVMVSVLSALLIAIVVLITLRWTVSERIRQMDRMIRDIGRTDFVPDVTVVGSPDFSDLVRRLDWLRRRLRNTEAQRTRFLRHVSHDLKTPLTAICEGAQLLSEGAAGPLDPRHRPLVDIVNKNAHRLQKFIEDMLNYQQVSSARVNLEIRAVRVDKLCESVLGAHIMAVGKRNLRIKRNLVQAEVSGDWNKLYAVVDNLVSNAIKFSPEEGVVTLNMKDESHEVVVDIIDQGNGVPEEERKRIFEPFFRGTRAHKGQVKGSGLGLAIARDYARAHRGRLELLDSQQGAHFRLTIPKNRGNTRVE